MPQVEGLNREYHRITSSKEGADVVSKSDDDKLRTYIKELRAESDKLKACKDDKGLNLFIHPLLLPSLSLN